MGRRRVYREARGRRLRGLRCSWVAAIALIALGVGTTGAQQQMGQEEFGLTERELAERVEEVEQLIAACMREQGFEYIAVDFQTVRRAMQADKVLPGLEEEQFIQKYGLGISTMYTGKPPQLAQGYSPAKMGFGRRNVEIFQSLSPADQVAYTRALCGENANATFVIGLESENFSRCGGCTRQAVEQVFEPDTMRDGYYNPTDAMVAKDRRMRDALAKYAREMREAGFDVDNPDRLEEHVMKRLDAITGGATIPVEEFTPEQIQALEKLQEYELRLATTSLELEEELIEPVEEKVEAELFSRRVE
jgi:hypothetical protein